MYKILAIVVLIGFSAYFSASETAFTSVNRIRIKNLANDGDKKARAVQELSERYDDLLSTILVGNNIVNIATSAIATVLFMEMYPLYGATISTIVVTIVVLIFGEISPKSLAKENPEKFAMASAPLLETVHAAVCTGELAVQGMEEIPCTDIPHGRNQADYGR